MTVDEIPTPPWPAHWKCTGCGHRRDDHAEPIVENGLCTAQGCDCTGWDPLTDEQWRAVYAEQRRIGG